ncbi:hypothetical protein EDB84DRAFT_1567509 [Lactarius hengduanensis]|nr:hypothetical protein EDB84DRAFT_1567509 [Lactarius hengduanensis]
MTTDVTFSRSTTNLPRAGLRDPCDAFRLTKTGNKATLTDRLRKLSADRKRWNGLIAVAYMKNPWKRTSTKQPSTGPPAFTHTPATAEADELRQVPYLAPPCSPSHRCGGYSPIQAASPVRPDGGHKRMPHREALRQRKLQATCGPNHDDDVAVK